MILAINGKSSSIKIALFKTDNTLTQLFNGEMKNIGSEK
jgi:acetate kinase